MQNQWVDINEYSRAFKVSISTIRRRIKSKKLQTRKRDGKYLIQVEKEKLNGPPRFSFEELQREMMLLKRENEELKMLVKIYEESSLGPS